MAMRGQASGAADVSPEPERVRAAPALSSPNLPGMLPPVDGGAEEASVVAPLDADTQRAVEEVAQPPPRPGAFRLTVARAELGAEYAAARADFEALLPYATSEDLALLWGYFDTALAIPAECGKARRFLEKATPYFGMYRVRFRGVAQMRSHTEVEYHFLNATDALEGFDELCDAFERGVNGARRRLLAHGRHPLGEEFDGIMRQLVDNLAMADAADRVAFAHAVRWALGTEATWQAVLHAHKDCAQEHGYWAAVLRKGGQDAADDSDTHKVYVVDRDEALALLQQLYDCFLALVAELSESEKLGGEVLKEPFFDPDALPEEAEARVHARAPRPLRTRSGLRRRGEERVLRAPGTRGQGPHGTEICSAPHRLRWLKCWLRWRRWAARC